jgi:hypothetical protein
MMATVMLFMTLFQVPFESVYNMPLKEFTMILQKRLKFEEDKNRRTQQAMDERTSAIDLRKRHANVRQTPAQIAKRPTFV